jgi:hypothetical protein
MSIGIIVNMDMPRDGILFPLIRLQYRRKPPKGPVTHALRRNFPGRHTGESHTGKSHTGESHKANPIPENPANRYPHGGSVPASMTGADRNAGRRRREVVRAMQIFVTNEIINSLDCDTWPLQGQGLHWWKRCSTKDCIPWAFRARLRGRVL